MYFGFSCPLMINTDLLVTQWNELLVNGWLRPEPSGINVLGSSNLLVHRCSLVLGGFLWRIAWLDISLPVIVGFCLGKWLSSFLGLFKSDLTCLWAERNLLDWDLFVVGSKRSLFEGPGNIFIVVEVIHFLFLYAMLLNKFTIYNLTTKNTNQPLIS